MSPPSVLTSTFNKSVVSTTVSPVDAEGALAGRSPLLAGAAGAAALCCGTDKSLPAAAVVEDLAPLSADGGGGGLL